MPPPSPPKLDDIPSQRDLSSTQLFRSNSEYFNDTTPSNVADMSPFSKRGASFQSSYGSQLSRAHGDWLTSGSQLTGARFLQPSLVTNAEDGVYYGDEDLIQESPELFTQRDDFNLQGAPFTTSVLEHVGSSEGMKTS